MKTTKGAEYELVFTDTFVEKEDITVPNEACIVVKGTWNQGHNPPLKMLCDIVNAEASCSMTLTYGTETETKTGSYSLSNVTLEMTPALTQGEYSAPSMVCVNFTGGSAAKCKLGMY